VAGNEKDKKAAETTASTSQGTAMDVFNQLLASGGGGVFIGGKDAEGKPKTQGLDEWTKQWFKMSETERQKYVDVWRALGKNVNVVTGVTIWEDYGRKSAAYAQQGGYFTPEDLWKMDARQGVSGAAAYTAQDAKALIESTYQQMLGRDASGEEYSKAYAKVMGVGNQTGAAGRQQALLDYIQSSDEYNMMQENRYLDAMYKAIAGEVREVQV